MGGVNLEKALRLNDRLGGHLVSGHVDGVGNIGRLSTNLFLLIGLPVLLFPGDALLIFRRLVKFKVAKAVKDTVL